MSNRNIVEELEQIIEQGLESMPLPYKKGNSIRIGHMIVRYSKKAGYLVYDAKESKQLAKTFCKATALAIAKHMAVGRDIRKSLLELDQLVQKHYNDAVFYKHVIAKTDSEFVKETRSTRLQDAIYRTEMAKHKIDRYIFGL